MRAFIVAISLFFAALTVSAEYLECDVSQPCQHSEALGYCLASSFLASGGKAFIQVGEITTLTELSPEIPPISYQESVTDSLVRYEGSTAGAVIDITSKNGGSFRGYILIPYNDDPEINELFYVHCDDETDTLE